MIHLNKLDKPHKIYTEVVEDSALSQFISAMEQDFVVQGALMPDVHTGYSLPIGAVVKTDGVIVPSWVGYDIGCGMCAISTNIHVDDVRRNADSIYNAIYNRIPVGYNHHKNPIIGATFMHRVLVTDVMADIYDMKNGDLQLGTLGGGNHFIEIGVDEDNKVWVIIHSGSRGVGHGCATHYMRLASPTGKASEGHYGFAVDSQEGRDYIEDMDFCLEFALENRVQMLKILEGVFCEYIQNTTFHWDTLINRNHNHAESKDGRFWTHRKGATHAEEGMLGVIPGNMRDGSFIVRGKGNPESLCSSSHGAGRVLGRRRAKETLNKADFEATMKGIVANVSKNTLDESPFAYKDIFEVMRLQEDLVEVITHVKPLINIKG